MPSISSRWTSAGDLPPGRGEGPSLANPQRSSSGSDARSWLLWPAALCSSTTANPTMRLAALSSPWCGTCWDSGGGPNAGLLAWPGTTWRSPSAPTVRSCCWRTCNVAACRCSSGSRCAQAKLWRGAGTRATAPSPTCTCRSVTPRTGAAHADCHLPSVDPTDRSGSRRTPRSSIASQEAWARSSERRQPNDQRDVAAGHRCPTPPPASPPLCATSTADSSWTSSRCPGTRCPGHHHRRPPSAL